MTIRKKKGKKKIKQRPIREPEDYYDKHTNKHKYTKPLN